MRYYSTGLIIVCAVVFCLSVLLRKQTGMNIDGINSRKPCLADVGMAQKHASQAPVGVTQKNTPQSQSQSQYMIVLPSSSEEQSLHAKIVPGVGDRELIVKIFNLQVAPDGRVSYAVYAQAEGAFNIAGTPSSPSNQSLDFRLQLPFTLPPSIPALEVYVYQMEFDNNGFAKKLPELIIPSPFHVVIPTEDTRKTFDQTPLPPCQTLTSLFPFEGKWLGRRARNASMMRTGWSYAPKMCSFEVFSPEEIVAAKTPTTIAILGSSIDRGVFTSLVDMILRASEKQELPESNAGKCWGRAEVKVNNIQIVYQDNRMVYMRPEDDDSGVVECHGENLALGPGFFRNGTQMLKRLISEKTPNVIWLGCGACHSMFIPPEHVPSCYLTLKKFIQEGAPRGTWNGTFLIPDATFNALNEPLTEEELQIHYEGMHRLQEFLNDDRVRLLDSTSLTSPMQLFAEQPGSRASQHFHRTCNNPGDEIRTCSNVTEAMAQLALAMALAPMGKVAWKAQNSHLPRTISSCFDCPEDLLPFHILPHPNLTCYEGPLQAVEKSGEPFPLPKCPLECLRQEPEGEVQTQSGKVDKRTCHIHDWN